ncbi:hypothetical protein H0A71_18855 [Alcaligenaceae bacterium]|nr:hypothetical protein [Alcaligenaceae bacterium]
MANAIPGKVDLVLEVRSDSDTVLDSFPEDPLSTIESAASELGYSTMQLSSAGWA